MRYVPESDLWMLIPFGIVAVLSVGGLLFPRTMWKVFWGWHWAYRTLPEAEQPGYVRSRMLVPLVLSVGMGLVLVLRGR